ncbi:MAG: PAS domain S-box protein, partial [Acidimicrobiales bacterium]
MVTDPAGWIRYVSPACSRVFGWRPNQLEGHHIDEFIHPHDLPVLHAARVELVETESSSTTYRFLCRDGSTRSIEAKSRRIDRPDGQFVVSVMRDVSDRQLNTITLERQARTDPLTGLANRTVLMDRLNQGLRRLGRGAGMLAVLYLDL